MLNMYQKEDLLLLFFRFFFLLFVCSVSTMFYHH